jgi:hypothetical protein
LRTKILFEFSQNCFLIPNLLLSEKTIHTAEGGADFLPLNSLAKTGETAWALLRNAHSLSSSKPFSSFKVCLLNHIRTYFQNK